MKQHITKEQWDELSRKQKEKIIKFFGFVNMPIPYYIDMGADLTIGQMIEFLGGGWFDWIMEVNKLNNIRFPEKDNLCDNCWEAVKEKLK
jgi:hypothetical protein